MLLIDCLWASNIYCNKVRPQPCVDTHFSILCRCQLANIWSEIWFRPMWSVCHINKINIQFGEQLWSKYTLDSHTHLKKQQICSTIAMPWLPSKFFLLKKKEHSMDVKVHVVCHSHTWHSFDHPMRSEKHLSSLIWSPIFLLSIHVHFLCPTQTKKKVE